MTDDSSSTYDDPFEDLYDSLPNAFENPVQFARLALDQESFLPPPIGVGPAPAEPESPAEPERPVVSEPPDSIEAPNFTETENLETAGDLVSPAEDLEVPVPGPVTSTDAREFQIVTEEENEELAIEPPELEQEAERPVSYPSFPPPELLAEKIPEIPVEPARDVAVPELTEELDYPVGIPELPAEPLRDVAVPELDQEPERDLIEARPLDVPPLETPFVPVGQPPDFDSVLPPVPSLEVSLQEMEALSHRAAADMVRPAEQAVTREIIERESLYLSMGKP